MKLTTPILFTIFFSIFTINYVSLKNDFENVNLDEFVRKFLKLFILQCIKHNKKGIYE
tara:strand:+ start:443 stop:616 length:174 start_codon:yes stop_codon:yes gene_type:complete